MPAAAVVILAGLASTGCSGKRVTLIQDEYINTAIHLSRAPGQRTGEPLEVNIVCVYPGDLEKPENALLSPDSNITSQLWFARRPQNPPQPGQFSLPATQVYVLTDEKDVYGKVAGKALRGAKRDGRTEVTVTGIEFKEEGWFKGGAVHSSRSVIYVFARFYDQNGAILPVPPAKFNPPGSYGNPLRVHIGVREPAGRAEQFIEIAMNRE